MTTSQRAARQPTGTTQRPAVSEAQRPLEAGAQPWVVAWQYLATRVQPKLRVGPVDGPAEAEADLIAEQVLHAPASAPPVRPHEAVSEVSRAPSPPGEASPSVASALPGLGSGGRGLEPGVRSLLEPRFGRDLGQVRIHTGPEASQLALRLSARAFALGRDVAFAPGEYAPHTREGSRLLAHELAHVLQHQDHPGHDRIDRDIYTPEERRAMTGGTVTGTPLDLQAAARCGFQPGDIVFRLGSRELAARIGDPVTHGGIYLGNGLIHDMVGFGNRTVPIVEFYAEAADAGVVRIIRFIGPLRDIIVPKVVANIRARNFRLPSDPVPWNLFSSANDYRTATCLEYSHAQFLHAIQQINGEFYWAPEVHEELRRTYFAGAAAAPNALIQPRNLQGSWGPASGLERRLLVGGANALAEDVDPSVFSNRWEGNPDDTLTAFTYRSFVDATRFFRAVNCPAATDPSSPPIGDASRRMQEQVLPIGLPTSVNRTDPVDRTVTRQTGIVWATHASGAAYLVLLSLENSSDRRPTTILFRAFVDQDLRDHALARAAPRQPRGVQTMPWSVITGIPPNPTPTAARRNP